MLRTTELALSRKIVSSVFFFHISCLLSRFKRDYKSSVFFIDVSFVALVGDPENAIGAWSMRASFASLNEIYKFSLPLHDRVYTYT